MTTRVTCVVCDGETGAPVLGAEAAVFGRAGLSGDRGETFRRHGRTDRDGSITWEVPLGDDGGTRLFPMARARGYTEWRDYLVRRTDEERMPRIELRGEGPHRIEAVLRPGPTLAGRVCDVAGAPIAGTAIDLTLAGPDFCSQPQKMGFLDLGLWPPPVVTDADGRFECLSFPIEVAAERGAHWVLTAEHDAYAPAMAQSLETLAADEDRVIHVALTLPAGCELRGRLCDADGRPVADAEVTATAATRLDQPQCIQFSKSVRSDAAGGFVFQGLAARRHDLEIAADGMAPHTATLDLAQPQAELLVVLSPGAVVEGELLDRHGQPMASTTVRLRIREPWLLRTVETDDRGRFRIAGLPQAGEAELLAADSDSRQSWVVTLPTPFVQLRIREQVALDVRLVAAEDGSPLAGCVGVSGAGLFCEVETGADGPIQPCLLAPARYELQGNSPGRAMVTSVVELPEEGLAAPILIPLAVGRLLAGRVISTEGEPLAHASILARTREPHERHATETEADGTFRLPGLNDEDYILAVSAEGRATHVARGVRPQHDLEIVLGEGGTVNGGVATADGTPLAHVLVQAQTAAGRSPLPLPSALSDAAGEYVLEHVPAGDMLIAAGDASHPLDVGHGGLYRVDFVLVP